MAASETRSIRSEETERHVIHPTKSEKQVYQVSHSGVGPRQWEDPMRTERQRQSIPESFLEVSRPSCGKLPHWRRTSDYAEAEHYTAVLE